MKNDYMEDFTASFTPAPDKTALLLIDMQYASACRTTGLGKNMIDRGQADIVAYRYDRIENIVVPNIKRMVDFFRKNRLHVIHITLGSEMPDYSDVLPGQRGFIMSCRNTRGNREHEILDELKPIQDECVINKVSIGAFNSSNIDAVLRNMGIEYLLFTGVSTNACVETTARDAADRGFRGIMISDACGATKEHLHNGTLENFRRNFGKVETTGEILAELSKT
ncbi:MAG: cysteine hydrolase [Dehalococcoidales bacterium]|nr:cysteine hydrolase [Dehalococcoidales bacterium]